MAVDLTFIPHAGFGCARLGMTASEVIACFPGPSKRVRARILFPDALLVAHLDAEGRVVLLETHRDAPNVLFDGAPLCNAAAVSRLLAAGHVATAYASSHATLDFIDLGLGFFLDGGIAGVTAYPVSYAGRLDMRPVTAHRVQDLPAWIRRDLGPA